MIKWKIKKTAKEDWTILRRKADDTEDGKEYYYISGPKGIYQDDDGNTYKFDTREEALEEVEYLKAEHKYEDNNKKEAKFKKKEEQSASFKLIDLMDKGILNPRTVVDSCLKYMSEDEIEDMAKREGYIDEE